MMNKKNWCTIFTRLKVAMHEPDVTGKIERVLNNNIVKHVPRSLLSMMACVSKATYFAIKQLMRHPYKRGDVLTLVTSNYENIGRCPTEVFSNMFVRINSVSPNARMVKVQHMHWRVSEENVLLPCVPKSRQVRKELEDTETEKRVRRIAAPIVTAFSKTAKRCKGPEDGNNSQKRTKRRKKGSQYDNLTTFDLNEMKCAFYVDYIDPKRRYTKSENVIHVEDVEACF